MNVNKDILQLGIALVIGLILGGSGAYTHVLADISERDQIIAEKEAELEEAFDIIHQRDILIAQRVSERDSLAMVLVHYSTNWNSLSQSERNEAQAKALDYLNNLNP